MGWGSNFWGANYWGSSQNANKTISPSGLASSFVTGTANITSSISAVGLVSSFASGTAVIGAIIGANGLSSSFASGNALLSESILALGKASNFASGSANITSSLLASGRASTFSSGTAVITEVISATGKASNFASGSAVITEVISAVGKASNFASGTPILGDSILANGLSSSFASGTAVLGNSILASGLASTFTTGTADILVPNVIDGSGLSSSFAAGTAVFVDSILANGIPSNFASGTAFFATPIVAVGLASSIAFGTPSITASILATGLASSFASGTAKLNESISALGLASNISFGDATFVVPGNIYAIGLPSNQDCSTLTKIEVNNGFIAGGVQAASGPITGNTPITIVAPGLAMSSVQDNFSTSTISSIWTQVKTGSGKILSIPSNPPGNAGTLQLLTGKTSGSSAGLRSQNTYTRFDAGVDVSFPLVNLANGGASISFSLGAYISPSTYFTASIIISRTNSVLTLFGIENGVISTNVSTSISNIRNVNLRVLRVDQEIYVFLNQSLVFKNNWTITPASIQFSLSNNSTTSNGVASITHYQRNPVILFGKNPMLQVLSLSTDRIDGLTPQAMMTGAVPINVTTDLANYNLGEEYTYTNAYEYTQIGISGTNILTTISDNSVLSTNLTPPLPVTA